MKRWKCILRGIILLTLTAALLGGGAGGMTMTAQAKEAPARGNEGVERLAEDEKRIYDTLKTLAGNVTSGKETSAVVTVNGFTSLMNSQEEIGRTINRALSYLLMDCPYDFYWYDKKGGCYYSWTPEQDGRVLTMTISMTVAEDYQGAEAYTVDPGKITKAKEAEQKAKAIVAKYRGKTDYEKLKGYMTEICDLVSYNWDVYENGRAPYGNPWQPVWVFDGDETTNVVCEGYAKAFQYLCDLSVLWDAKCYTVEGAMSGGTGSGDHMWNIVTLGDKNYLVDVTNCDTDSIGAPDQLFMAGAEGSIGGGYTVFLDSGQSITYQYADNQYDLLGDALELSYYPYEDPSALNLKVTAPEGVEVTFGDSPDDSVLAGGSAVNGAGKEVPGVFTWAGDMSTYGNAGTNTLNAVFTPTNPQYQPVNYVRVSVKVNRRPVTVTAEEKSKSYGQPDPELTYFYSNVIEEYPLSGELSRTSGENVGTYSIGQGTLTDDNNPNYAITFTGASLKITPASVMPLEFVVGDAKATVANAVTIKEDASYGDLWSEIVKIRTITAQTGFGNDSDPAHFTLQESGTPAVGGGQSFHIVYNGTIGGQTYRNEPVCEGTVDIKRRVLTVSAGSYRVSKAYDKTRAGGDVSGQLAIHNLLSADTNRVSVAAEPAGYASPDVSGQNRMTVNLTLTGAASGNYELYSNTVEVPCEITPKTITPSVKVSGTYAYTSRAITPTITVSDGNDVLSASEYNMVLSNNQNVGTAKVTIRPKSGGNYTWNPAVETTFTIDKADYRGTKTASTSMEYGGTAIFSLYSMLSEGYKLGDIHVSDPDKIFADTPAVSGTVLSCKMSEDRSKEGKSAVITLPVTESRNYNPYDLTFKVTMAAQRSGAGNNNPPAITTPSGNGGGTGSEPSMPSDPTTEIGDGRTPASDYDTVAPGGANVTVVDRENTKAARSKGIGAEPILWGAIGGTLTLGVCGGVYLIRRRKKAEKQ